MKKRLFMIMLIFFLLISFNVNANAKVKLNKTQLTMTVGQTKQLKVKNIRKGKKIKWSSGNKKIASVSKKGKVSAKAKGSTKITAKVGKKKYICKVTVKNKQATVFDDGRDFYEGVAWVKPEGKSWRCVNTDGSVRFVLGNNQNPTSDFTGGIATLSDNSIIDKNGKIIASATSGKYTSISRSDSGYVFVHVYSSTLTETSNKIGILNNKGEWYMEPQNLLNNGTYFESKGQGIYNFFKEKYYDLYTNEWIDTQTKERRQMERSFSEGLLFIRSGEGTALGIENEKQGFYDLSGKCVIDLSEYSYASDLTGFHRGYCLVALRNPQGKDFHVVIDKNGNFMYEPIAAGWFKGYGCGLYSYGTRNGASYYDIYGKRVFDVSGLDPLGYGGVVWNGGSFSEDGILKVGYMSSGGVHYINLKGEAAF